MGRHPKTSMQDAFLKQQKDMISNFDSSNTSNTISNSAPSSTDFSSSRSKRKLTRTRKGVDYVSMAKGGINKSSNESLVLDTPNKNLRTTNKIYETNEPAFYNDSKSVGGQTFDMVGNRIGQNYFIGSNISNEVNQYENLNDVQKQVLKTMSGESVFLEKKRNAFIAELDFLKTGNNVLDWKSLNYDGQITVGKKKTKYSNTMQKLKSSDELISRDSKDAIIIKKGPTTKTSYKSVEPIRIKTHWDYLLLEMKWLASDMRSERKWKISIARKLSKRAQKKVNQKANKQIQSQVQEQKELRKIAKNISNNVLHFWGGLEKVCKYKRERIEKSNRSKERDMNLNFLIDQTAKFSSELAENLNESNPVKSKDIELDDSEYIPSTNMESDDEESIEIEEKETTKEELEKEINNLQELSSIPMEELIEKEYRNENRGSPVQSMDEIYLGGKIESEFSSSSGQESDLSDSDDENTGETLTVKLLTRNSEGDLLPVTKSKRKRGVKKPSNEDSIISETVSTLVPIGNDLSSTKVNTKVPFLLKGTLREYQHVGLDWLVTLYNKKLNGILADEMGLGKTIQTIALLAHLACEKGIWGPHLIVVPTSVILNWELEFKRWLPGFKVLSYYGSVKERKEKRTGWSKPNSFHVCITSYTLAVQDQSVFRRKKWKYLILDEAHNIKNFKSKRWQTLLTFDTKRRLLLTGTPLQNSLMELWSLLHFLMPYIFESRTEFRDWFADPVTGMVEGSESFSRGLIERLHVVLRPFLLRRLKKDVAKQLPNKIEHVVSVPLSKRQKYLYQDFISRAETRSKLKSGGYLGMMNVLMQLRKVCNHPDLFEPRPIVSPFSQSPLDRIVLPVPSMILNMISTNNFLASKSFISMSLNDFWYTIEERIRKYPKQDDKLLEFLSMTEIQIGAEEYLNEQFWQRRKRKRLNYYEDELTRKNSRLKYSQNLKKMIEEVSNNLSKTYFVSKIENKKKLNDSFEKLPPNTTYLEFTPGSVLSSLFRRPEEVIFDFEPLLSRVVFQITRVNSFTPIISSSRVDWSIKNTEMQNEEFITLRTKKELTPFRKAYINNQLYFPDKRLLMYDCGKLQILSSMLKKLFEGGHRCLIFTQMSKMLNILEEFLSYHGYKYLRLDGSTRPEHRQYLMDKFNVDNKIFCFILSTRSGGVGVNLVGADTVIFYDSDWNPAMDAQAQDRCHRIGQTREVNIYRLVTEHSVEENILKKSNQKRHLDSLVIQEGNFNTKYFHKLNAQDIFGEDINDLKIEEKSKEKPGDLKTAMALVEDEDDRNATLNLEKEQAEELNEFNEDVSIHPSSSTGVVAKDPRAESRSFEEEADISSLEELLNPVERYALRVLEIVSPEISEYDQELIERNETMKKDLELKTLRQKQAGIDSDEENGSVLMLANRQVASEEFYLAEQKYVNQQLKMGGGSLFHPVEQNENITINNTARSDLVEKTDDAYDPTVTDVVYKPVLEEEELSIFAKEENPPKYIIRTGRTMDMTKTGDRNFAQAINSDYFAVEGLAPQTKKSEKIWTPNMEINLINLFKKIGPQWQVISETLNSISPISDSLSNFSVNDCIEKYNEISNSVLANETSVSAAEHKEKKKSKDFMISAIKKAGKKSGSKLHKILPDRIEGKIHESHQEGSFKSLNGTMNGIPFPNELIEMKTKQTNPSAPVPIDELSKKTESEKLLLYASFLVSHSPSLSSLVQKILNTSEPDSQKLFKLQRMYEEDKSQFV